MGIYTLVVLLAVLTAGIYAPTLAESELDDTVQIGALVPITGSASTHGEDIRIAIEVAESDFNQYLQEINAGWTLDVLIEDSATNPVVALDKLSSMNAKGIGSVVGTYSSAELRNIKGYSDNNGMILISYGSVAPSLAIPNDSIFRFVPDDTNNGPVISKMFEISGITNVVPIWRGDAWGDGLVGNIRTNFEATGGVMDEGIRYNPEAIEFSTEVALLSEFVARHTADVGADKVAVMTVSFSEVTNLAQSASGYDNLASTKWFGTDAIVGIDALVTDPIISTFFDSAGLTTAQFAPSQNPTYKRVSATVADISGRTPTVYALPAYDAVWVLGLSILSTDSTDTQAIKDEMPRVLEDYEGAIGKIVLNEAGDLAEGTFEIWDVMGSEWVLTGTYDAASDSIILQDDAMMEDEMMDDTMMDDTMMDDTMMDDTMMDDTMMDDTMMDDTMMDDTMMDDTMMDDTMMDDTMMDDTMMDDTMMDDTMMDDTMMDDTMMDDTMMDDTMMEDEMKDDTMVEDEEGGGCLIATAAYGSELSTQVQLLREIRDDTLYQTAAGTSFMTGFNQFYYSFSPAVADLERENQAVRDVTRAAITPAIYALGIMTHADSETTVLIFGIITLFVIAGIYLAPLLAAYVVARRVKRIYSSPSSS